MKTAKETRQEMAEIRDARHTTYVAEFNERMATPVSDKDPVVRALARQRDELLLAMRNLITACSDEPQADGYCDRRAPSLVAIKEARAVVMKADARNDGQEPW